MATLGTYNYARHEGNKELAAQLVANEGITNLKADCEVVSQSVTLQLTGILHPSLDINPDKHAT